MELTFALTGNPNVGKTSLYNRLTHSSRHVGNWHGVTVDKMSKALTFDGNNINIVDLPGLYSLTVYSFEEEISRDEVLGGKNDLIVNICEANNLSRNLYLALQLIELDVPVMLVINMMDELYKRGKTIDVNKISNTLKVPILPVSARRGFDGKALLSAGVEYTRSFDGNKVKLPYLNQLPLKEVEKIIGENLDNCGLKRNYACIKVLERDKFVLEKLALSPKQISSLEQIWSKDWLSIIAKLRYDFIDTLTYDIIIDKGNGRVTDKINAFLSDNADKLILNKILALPIFVLIMSAIFWVTFGFIGQFATDLLETSKDFLVSYANAALTEAALPDYLVSLVSYGIIDGIGGVLIFLPQIVLLFFFLALLEDSGYISRVAFMTDGMFRKIGLSGRAVFTMIMGLGCSATAVLTARGLEDDMMRKKTVVLTPFMSCSARLPVYTAIAGAFFTHSVIIILGLYLLGATIVILLAALMQSSDKLKSGSDSFIMEMPPYRLPTAERVLQIIVSNAKTFLVKVGTTVFAFNVIVWILCNFSFTSGFVPVGAGESIMEKISTFIAPIFAPLGFGNWKAVTALMSGLVAKETVISTITSLGGVQSVFTDSVSAICFLIYTLLYVPCIATLGAVKKEIGLKGMALGLILQLFVAYVVALIFRVTILAFMSGVCYGIAALCFVGAIIIMIALSIKFIDAKGKITWRVRCSGDCKNCK